jgi:hypothetical protein
MQAVGSRLFIFNYDAIQMLSKFQIATLLHLVIKMCNYIHQGLLQQTENHCI